MASGKSPKNKAISILDWIYDGNCVRTSRETLDPHWECGENNLAGAKTEKKKNFKDRFAFRISILLKLHDFEEINFSELVLWYLFFIQ